MNDFKQLNIMKNESELENMSKNAFKNLVLQKSKQFTFQQLLEQKSLLAQKLT